MVSDVSPVMSERNGISTEKLRRLQEYSAYKRTHDEWLTKQHPSNVLIPRITVTI